MTFLKRAKQLELWKFGWQFLFSWLFLFSIIAAVIASVIIGIQGRVTPVGISLIVFAGVVFASAVLAGFFGMLLLTYENVRSIKNNGERLENVAEMLSRNQAVLEKIAHSVSLSDSAKEIAFRENDIMELNETVLKKLHQHDFETTFDMIETIKRKPEFASLAEKLQVSADQYKNNTEEGRIKQAISHIEALLRQKRWSSAASQIDSLVKSFPDSERASHMVKRLSEMKNKRKKELLDLWDKAVKRGDVDQGLEILKELDHYLTPTEGLALRESASNIYRLKLHNLGVQFSLAVTEKQWQNAINAAKLIIREFPNSRMAHEITPKMDALEKRAAEKANQAI